MGHTPYGYRIENGKAVIDEAAATQVRELYKNYLSGLSLTNAAKEAGLDLLHSGAKRMMRNSHYLGDDFYPAITTNYNVCFFIDFCNGFFKDMSL